MIALKNKPNVTAPTSTYPHGRLTDDTGSGNGTPITQYTNNDIHSFLQQLMVDAGVTPNNILDNEYDGFQLNTALGLFINKLIYAFNHDDNWHTDNIVYGTNWVTGGGGETFHYRKTKNGTQLQFRGSVSKSSGNLSNGETLFTLPAGFRPSSQRGFPIFVTGNAAGTYGYFCFVNTDGTVVVGQPVGSFVAAATPGVYFDSIEIVL